MIDPAQFTSAIDNPFHALTPGTKWVYEGDEHIEVVVTDQTREVMGVTCVVVRDTVTVEGEIVEDTYDWYAQDLDGNVWCFGEDSTTYEGGQPVSTDGSWEGGVDNARPGIIMQAAPKVGDVYRQEYLPCEAEDMAEVVEVGVSVTVPWGSYTGCIKTRDYTPLEPNTSGEYKFYCPDVGLVLETDADTNERVTELTEVQMP